MIEIQADEYGDGVPGEAHCELFAAAMVDLGLDPTFASVVAVNKNHERLVGRVARNQAITNPQNTIFSIKRFMGRKAGDPEVERTKKRVPYIVS